VKSFAYLNSSTHFVEIPYEIEKIPLEHFVFLDILSGASSTNGGEEERV
jgi:hypothetical protein